MLPMILCLCSARIVPSSLVAHLRFQVLSIVSYGSLTPTIDPAWDVWGDQLALILGMWALALFDMSLLDCGI